MDIITYKDLYEFLRTNDIDILKWLEDNWKGKDKQESLFRLLAYLGLVPKINNYDICTGNFNMATLKKLETIKDTFYDESNKLKNLKDKGDSSDLSAIHKENPKNILATTSKNINKQTVDKLDIDKILTNFKQYEEKDYILTLCFVIRNKEIFQKMISNIEKTNHKLLTLILKGDTIIIDWKDLLEGYNNFKSIYKNIPFEIIINSNKRPLILKLHQIMGVNKTIYKKNTGIVKQILWGHVQRSGKSYIIAGTIIENDKEIKNSNYLLMTTAPNETVEQYLKVLNSLQLSNFNIIHLNGKNKKKPESMENNIVVCSKQFLESKLVKPIAWLKNMNFEIRFLDESHNGGTTELSKKILEYYGNTAFTIQITASYIKPTKDYNIPREDWILWDLEDIKLCKNIKNEKNIDRLTEKHGPEFKKLLELYSIDNIIEEYSKYPELHILCDKLRPEVVEEVLKSTSDNSYGWSTTAAFLLKQNNKGTIDEFQNEEENLKIWYRIFGKPDKFGINDKNYPDDNVFMKRIEKICKNPDINSRYIGNNNGEPMIIMAFLPQNDIDKISNATKKLLEKNNVIPEYEIVIINSTAVGSNPKKTIEEGREKAKNLNKKAVLVLSGRQCSLGVTIKMCDIVLLLNNNMSFDMIYQMMFRSMSEEKNKKCGFVVDLNIHRVVETSIMEYASIIKPNIHPKEAIKYILQEKLINLNGDHWMPSFGHNMTEITTLANSVYECYSSNTVKALQHFLDRLSYKQMILTTDEQIILNTLFNNNISKKQKDTLEKLLNDIEDDDENIKKGIDKTKDESKNDNEIISNDSNDSNNEIVNKVGYMDILKHIIPLICLLTIHYEDTSFIEMYNYIENNEYIYKILVDQTRSWWGKNIDVRILKKFIKIYIKYLKDDKEINQIIIIVKELFVKNINNQRELSNLIDKYFIPQELEVKSNAEITTPFILRNEMLDKIPLIFWNKPKKVLEPCCGKGGFLIDIIGRFMIGLKETYPDEKERYKIIVEECLYWCDINLTNIFICKLLIDPYNIYKLNYYDKNTLTLDVLKAWNFKYFDAIVCNPPYEEKSENGVSKGGGNNLYTKFIYFADSILNKNGYLLFINPPTYFSPGRSNNKNDTNLRKDVLNKYKYHYINLEECARHFNVGSKFIYYLAEKSNTVNTNLEIVCKYKNNIYKTIINQELLNKSDYLPYLLTGESMLILAKVKNDLSEKLAIFNTTVFDKRRPYVNNKEKKETDEEYKTRSKNNKFVYPIQATGSQIVYASKECIYQTKKKVLMSESGYLKPFYDDGVIGVGGHCFACLVKDKKEGEYIIKLLNSNIYKFYIEVNKWSGFHNKEVMKDLPYIKIKDDFNNNDIYNYFKLAPNEIKFIENNI